jgi:FMN phosphatase YigB (HAD superfamily)
MSAGETQPALVAFDLGGTLVSEEIPQLAPLPSSFAEQLGMSEEEVSRHVATLIGRLLAQDTDEHLQQIPAQEIFESYAREVGLEWNAEVVDEAAWLLIDGGSRAFLKPLPGAENLLTFLQTAGTRIAALSNTSLPPRLLHRLLESHGLLRFFSAITLSSECGWRKPAPQALDALERVAGDCALKFFVGNDLDKDITPARARGYQCILVTELGIQVPGVFSARSLADVEGFLRSRFLA